jgi:hypothetical protein
MLEFKLFNICLLTSVLSVEIQTSRGVGIQLTSLIPQQLSLVRTGISNAMCDGLIRVQ